MSGQVVLWEEKLATSPSPHELGTGRALRVVQPDGFAPIVQRLDGGRWTEITPYSPSRWDLEDPNDAHDAIEALRFTRAEAERLARDAPRL